MSEIIYSKKVPNEMMQEYDLNGEIEAISLESVDIAGEETYFMQEKFIR